MVELFSSKVETMDLQQQHTDLQDILLTKDGQERAKERHENSKALLIYHFKYIFICFVLEENTFHCFLNFIDCCLQFAYFKMQLFAEGSVDEVV